MSELLLNEWIVIFYPQTGATRLCPTFDFAKSFIKSKSLTNVYKSPNEFRVKHDHAFLEKCWKTLYRRSLSGLPKSATGTLDDYSEVPPDVGTEEFVKLLWAFLQDVGDRVASVEAGGMKNETTATKENYELNRLEIQRLMEDGEAFANKYNKQARTVLNALFESDKQFLNEDEIKRLIYRLVADRQLKTKQEPWVIFQYYRPQFIKDGYVVRGKRRMKKTRA